MDGQISGCRSWCASVGRCVVRVASGVRRSGGWYSTWIIRAVVEATHIRVNRWVVKSVVAYVGV